MALANKSVPGIARRPWKAAVRLLVAEEGKYKEGGKTFLPSAALLKKTLQLPQVRAP